MLQDLGMAALDRK